MNNVHEDQPVVFQTRWALSYLRGPLTREQIQTLMAPRKQAKAITGPAASPAAPSPRHGDDRLALDGRPPAPASGTGVPSLASSAGSRPVVPPDVPEFFIPRRGSLNAGATIAVPAGAAGRGPAPLCRQEAGHRFVGDAGAAPAGRGTDADRCLA